MEQFIINLLNGLSYGMVLFLIASGMSVVMGAMNIINLAHGVLYMVGGYVGWTIAVQFGAPFVLGLLTGGLAAGLVGLAIERGFLRLLYKQPNEQVLLTFGFVYILTNLSLWIWGGWPRMPFTAKVLSGSVEILGKAYPKARLATILIGFILAIVLWWLQDKTRVGAMVRAGMDNKEMTMGLGINLERLFALVFFVASCIAGVAGVLGAQLLGVYNALGLEILLLALIVIIVGGVGSVQGALLGGILIGVIDAFGRALFPKLAMFTMYFTMIIILLVRPSGLLGRRT
ncbi:MAG: branched-chain amino acid ABC transporter permease [Deltaproteobacteria bacterium]|nr:MAG: branched-chain amino acid ABC transporter permease [Deltaproteobacteria bacterium]